LAQDVLDSISNAFYNSSGSVTAALRKAIIETNQNLLELNLSGTGASHLGALTCAVLRGTELFMAQVGEGLALLGHNFGIERLPPTTPDHVTPLGQTAGIDIRFYHNWLQSGDILLLSDPRLAHIPTDAFSSVLVDSDVEDGMRQLVRAIGADTARVLLIEFDDEETDYTGDFTTPAAAVVSARRLAPPTSQPRRITDNVAEPASPEVQPPQQPGLEVETMEVAARKATSKAANGLSRITGWLAAMLTRLRSPMTDGADSTSWAWPAFLAVIIPIVIAAIVTSVYFQRGRVLQLSATKQEIGQHLDDAHQAGEGSETAAFHYSEVLRLADEAQKLRPDDGDVERMRQEALAELDVINKIARLTARRLQEYESDTFLTAISLGDENNGGIYTLDAAGNRIFAHDTDPSYLNLLSTDPEQVLFGEQVLGSHVVGHIVDLLWRPRGSNVDRDGLAALDNNGALVSHYPNFSDSRAVPLGLASDWVEPTSITTFNERLYILDVGAEQIWRYFAEGEGFNLSDEQRSIDFVEDADLDQAVDFAIYSEDGSVIILYQDGRLRRYVNGRAIWNESDLADSGLEQPLVAPSAVKISGRGLNSSIFVSDPGSSRLVQISLGGTFLAQFKAMDESGNELFSAASDFALASDPLRIFVVSGNELYVVTQE
jgi:hypothetical protein